jgi:hypothetical protein
LAGQCGDAPAGHRRDRLCRFALGLLHQAPAPEDEGGDAARLRRELQTAARGQIELADLAEHRAEGAGLQALLHGPEGFVILSGCDQDQAVGIESELPQAMGIKIQRRARRGAHDPEHGPLGLQPGQP